jgi:hypothetical protein
MRLGRVSLILALLWPLSASAQELGREGPIPAPHGNIPYLRLLGTALAGTGLRLNNPYRLATPLGEDAESVSRTAAYVDLGATMLVGHPSLLQHGPGLRLSIAIEGIGQQVLAPSYLVCKEWRSLQPCARVGIPLVIAPDGNVGAELGLGATYWVRSGLGATGEIVGSLFYGASTRDTKYPAYPIVSFQAGLIVSYEVLP